MTFRDALPADAPGVRDLIHQLGYPDIDERGVVEKIHLHQQETYRILVAEEGTRIVGFLALHWAEVPHRNGKIGRVTAMCTNETVRSKGIGGKMLKEAESILLSQGCYMVEVTSNNRRGGAHAFYLRQGYEETSKRFVKNLK